jgi:hypothetical protein
LVLIGRNVLRESGDLGIAKRLISKLDRLAEAESDQSDAFLVALRIDGVELHIHVGIGRERLGLIRGSACRYAARLIVAPIGPRRLNANPT